MARRAGQRLRLLLRDRRRQVIRERKTLLAKLLAAYGVCTSAFVAVAAWIWRPEIAWFSAGLSLGALSLLIYVFLEDPDTTRLDSAAVAEELTSQVVRKLRRSGWRVFDNVEFHRFDVDHVAIGLGGVFAIETKWASHPWSFTPDGRAEGYAAAALTQSESNSVTIRNLLRGNYKIDVEVRPVVVVWGAGLRGFDEPVLSGRVMVMRGSHLRSHLESLGHRGSFTRTDDVASALSDFIATRARHDRARSKAVTVVRQ
jgi:hypothetical protein